MPASRDRFTDIDFSSREFNENYAEVLQDLLIHCPVAAAPGYHVVSRDADIRRIAEDWQTFSNADGINVNRPDNIPLVPPEESDPPYHDRWRRVLDPHFDAKAVNRLEDLVRARADSLIDDFIEKGECEFVTDFAAALPGEVFFSSYLNEFPMEKIPSVCGAARDALTGSKAEQAAGWAYVFATIESYLLARKTQSSKDDWIDAVLRGVELDNGTPSPWEHKVGLVADMTVGVFPMSYTLAGMAYHLATNPTDRMRLAEDRSFHGRAVEEFIRIYAPVVSAARIVKTDVEVAGHQFRKGDWLALSFAAACRDPKRFENPNEIRIDRHPQENAAFGFGVHTCIGLHLVRLQVRITLEQLVDRIPDLSVAEGKGPSFKTGVLTRSMLSLPLVFTPGHARRRRREGKGDHNDKR